MAFNWVLGKYFPTNYKKGKTGGMEISSFRVYFLHGKNTYTIVVDGLERVNNAYK